MDQPGNDAITLAMVVHFIVKRLINNSTHCCDIVTVTLDMKARSSRRLSELVVLVVVLAGRRATRVVTVEFSNSTNRMFLGSAGLDHAS